MPTFANIRGFDELENALALLPKELQGKYLAQGMSAGAAVFQAEVKARTPVRNDGRGAKKFSKNSKLGRLPGFLKALVTRQLVRDGNQHGLTYRIGWGRKGFYGAFYELGTKHQPARPIVIPAIEAVQQRAVFQVGEKIGRLIDAFAATQPKAS